MGDKTDEISRKYQNPDEVYLFLGQKSCFGGVFVNKNKKKKNYTNLATIGAIFLN